MSKEKDIEESLIEKLDKLIESKKDESSALKKIFESFENGNSDNQKKQNQKK